MLNTYVLWNLFEEVEGLFKNIVMCMGLSAVFVNSLMFLFPVNDVFASVRLLFPALPMNKNAGERSYGQDCSF